MLPKNDVNDRLSKEFRALTEVAKTLTFSLELSELLDAVLKKIIGVVEQADVGTVMLWDQPAGLFRPAAAFGFDLEILKEMGLRAGESVTGKVYDEGKPRLLSSPDEVADAMGDMRPFNRQVFARSLRSESLPRCVLAAPISTGEKKYGVLVLETLDGNKAFTQNDLPFIQTLADLIALAIDRDHLETQLNTVRDARRTEYLRAEIMAILSHELRIPLSAIKGYSSALQLDEVVWSREKQQEFLHLIEEECDNMQTMLKAILDSSLIEVEQLKLERQPMRLQQLAKDIVQEEQRRTDTHRILVDLPADFPIVEIDPRWMKQVFRNILENAIRYSPDGGLIIIRGESRLMDVVISIADEGIGISPENLIPIFEKYFRVPSASGYHAAGIGLGLPIARAVVEAHGGRIWIESKLGEGTTVFFSLPKAESHHEREDSMEPDAMPVQGSES
ncbi:MAG: GAF domain-containing protein [Chloroflexi bacterium]|nr:GAF domain-containing protein [Chloroflexota bacterium]